MKSIFTLSFCFLFYIHTIACSFPVFPFCQSAGELEHTAVFVGIITNQFEKGVQIAVIETLRSCKTENTNQIRIWDGTDINCNGLFPMTTNFYGELGDTVICTVEAIQFRENIWEVIGDYRRPSSLNHTTYLNVINGGFPKDFYEQQNTYNEFLENWKNGECVETPFTAFPVNKLTIYPNPTLDRLTIRDDLDFCVQYNIISIDGRILKSAEWLAGNNEIVVADLAAGCYILQMIGHNGATTVNRFVKI